MSHIDLFAANPMENYAKLIERVSPDDPRVERFWDATYVGASSKPHEDTDCPFRDHPIIPIEEVDR